ncbi:MAG: hypothetical protein R2735_12965 [Microthrixaceae bacterium]
MVTTTLHVLGQVTFNFNLSIAQILISVGTSAVLELAIVLRRQRVIAWPASAMLSGNGIALILRVPGTEHGDWWSLHGWYIFAGTGTRAWVKYLIRWRDHHVFQSLQPRWFWCSSRWARHGWTPKSSGGGTGASRLRLHLP